MKTAVDTNVISALWSVEPTAAQMTDLLGAARNQGSVVICGAVYAELLAHPKASQEFVDRFLNQTNVTVDFEITESVWRLAAKSFASYADRRRKTAGSEAKRLLVDFLVGAHASLCADRLLSLDSSRYLKAFPSLTILSA